MLKPHAQIATRIVEAIVAQLQAEDWQGFSGGHIAGLIEIELDAAASGEAPVREALRKLSGIAHSIHSDANCHEPVDGYSRVRVGVMDGLTQPLAVAQKVLRDLTKKTKEGTNA